MIKVESKEEKLLSISPIYNINILETEEIKCRETPIRTKSDTESILIIFTIVFVRKIQTTTITKYPVE